MSYTITTTAGQTLATIADGTVNSTNTSLTLIGKNYAGYGIFLNENYIKLLENFNNTTAPNAPLTGQLWYDGANSVLKVYTGNQWKPISSSATGTTQPSSAVTVLGDLWYDTQNAQLKVFGGSSWITIGPSYTTTSGTSGAVVETITDTLSTSHIAVKFYISNTVVAILSKDTTAYTPSPGISGFTTIKPGLNLVSSSTIAGAQFTGDASNALSLQGVNASSFLRSDVATSTSYQLGVASLLVNSDLTLSVTSNDAYITNGSLGKNIYLNVNRTSGGPTNVLTVNGSTGLVSLTNALTVAGITTVSSTTAASSSTTGALIVGGGVGIAGAVYTAGALNVQAATASSSTSTGALIVTGGAGVGGNIWAGGFNTAGAATVNSANIQATTAATNTATGALRVMGGIGVAGTVFAGNINTSGNVLAAGGVFNTLTVNSPFTVSSNLAIGTLGAISGSYHTVIGNITQTSSGGANLYITTTGTVIAAVGQFGAINSTGNVLSTGLSVFGNARIGSLATPGAGHTIIGNVEISGAGTEYVNIGGNIMAVQGSFGSINSTGFINTSGNVSAAVHTGGAVTVTGSISGGYFAHSTGTTAMAFGSYNVVRVTPNNTATYTTTVPTAGAICVLSILTSGGSSYTITFGTGFKSTGTLATGSTSNRYFNITFVSDGTNLIETARTVAIA